MTKRFFLDQHGCAKNQVDGELLIGILAERGWQKTQEPEEADLIVINSCGFIEPAKRESIEAVVTARTAYPHAKILLAGCLAERYGEVFRVELEEADAFFGNGDLSKLPLIIDELFPPEFSGSYDVAVDSSPYTEASRYTEISCCGAGKKKSPPPKTLRPFLKPAQEGVCCGSRPELLNFPRSAFIKITEGCNNCCSFCAIPLIRGSVRSRPLSDIVSEIAAFVQGGYKEFNLIGQDLAVYNALPHMQESPLKMPHRCSPFVQPTDAIVPIAMRSEKTQSGLAQLLEAISGIGGNFSVRLLYIHPDHFPLDILPIMTRDTRFLPYFDIPFQSGSDPIIRAMNRCGSAKVYEELVENIRAAFRKAASPYGEPVIRTTFLTGFPGETDEDFDRTARFLQSIRSLWSGAFVYSQEEGTKAASFKKKVPKKIAEARKAVLSKLQLNITEHLLANFCGRKMDILIEELIPTLQDAETLQAAESSHKSGTTRGSTGRGKSSSDCLALGRAWFQAPEVDGAVVVHFRDGQHDSEGKPIQAGSIIRVRITALRGIDLEAEAL